MNIDDIKLIAPVIGFLALLFGLYQYRKSKPIYKLRMFSHEEINTDECGTYLCARVHISNVGGRTGVFNGFIAIDSKGEEYYPISTFDGDQEIKPENTISGAIPIGHIISYPPKALYMQDGLFNKIKMPNKYLKNTINELKAQKIKYGKHGWPFQPTKGIK